MPGGQEAKQGLHPRNRHRGRYDFAELTRSCPELAAFVKLTPYQDESIDFADPEAVRALNRALLKHFYGIHQWDLPAGYLCPPIPGRADYLHHIADLLGAGGPIPRGGSVRVLDIGVGANCIYPLRGHQEYGWRFLGSDIDPAALAAAGRILQANAGLAGAIELRLQPDPAHIFQGLLRDGETFALSICNPPFHASPGEAREAARRKLGNLGKGGPFRLNFGGRGAELWCPGGETGFVGRMIAESARIPTRCRWFSTLVARSSSLPALRRALGQAGALATRTLDMAQGQKQSRILAWTFQPDPDKL
jgi:23S rRNA (adenine1618-N6)-methyltransferase